MMAAAIAFSTATTGFSRSQRDVTLDWTAAARGKAVPMERAGKLLFTFVMKRL